MDIVYITGLEFDAVIGVYDWERNIRQTLVLDLEMASDIRRGAATDAIQDALDYAAISEAVGALVSGSSYQLIESVAEAERIKLLLPRQPGFGNPAHLLAQPRRRREPRAGRVG